MAEQFFAPGQYLITEGAQGASLMILTDGAAEVHSDQESGLRNVINQVSRGDVVGEMSLLTGEPRSADVVAQSHVRAMVLPADVFHRLAQEYPSLSIVLTRLVAKRLGTVEHDVLAGKEMGGYMIQRRLGVGGMSVVYEAIDPTDQRQVALKIMSHRLVYDAPARRFFEREARIIQSFDHPDIVQMRGRFEAFKTFFMVMEFCDGQPLSEVIQSHGPLPKSEIRKVVGTVGLALDYAHQMDVIHRDIKPSNIMINQDGSIKLMDFGLASPADELGFQANAPIVGTPGYMSPEQMTGGPITPATDYFGLGCALFEMLTGARAVPDRRPATLVRFQHSWKSPDVRDECPSASDELCQLLESLLARDAAERHIDTDRLTKWKALVDTTQIRIASRSPTDVDGSQVETTMGSSAESDTGSAELGSITRWITGIREGGSTAANELWNRYYRRLVGLARKKLRDSPRRVADEEDVALSTFNGFCRSAEEGRFPSLDDRDDLWQVLVMLTARKAANQIKHLRRAKRGGGNVRGESVFMTCESDEERRAIDQVVGASPSADFAGRLTIEFRELFEQLGDESLQALAAGKMQGYTNHSSSLRMRNVVETQ